MSGVLEGVRILDLSMGQAGPMATMALADNGADVIKIEPPSGDPNRDRLGFHVWARGKRNAIFDFDNADDIDTFINLVKSADVLVESNAPDTLKKIGLDFDSLHKINPRLIYCSITAYGRDNPLSDRPAIDALVAAKTGLHYEQRGRLGGVYHASGGEVPFSDFEFNTEGVMGPRHEDRDGPLFTGIAWPSVGAAYCALTAINTALLVRARSGRGQWLETSLMQGALTAGTLAFSYAENPDAPHFSTWITDTRSPKGNFECKDGRWIINWVPNPSFILGASEGETLNASPDMSAREDPDRIMPAIDDMLVLDHYYPMLDAAFKRFDADQWVEAGAVAGQCIQKIRSPEEGLNDPAFLADGCVAEIYDSILGVTRQVGALYNLEHHPATIGQSVAKAGQHNDEVRALAAGAANKVIARSDKQAPSAPLAGITVIDLGLAIAGPFGAQVLSDLGARVIKINATYDWYWHSNAIAMSANRGKESIAINMRDPKGVELIQKLCSEADVLIHNMRYKAVVNKGLDYETLKTINPKLVYCHTRGFEKGARESLPGNDQTGSALSGVQWEDGACGNGGRPYWCLTSLGDTGNGYLAVNAILQALQKREQTGLGQFVDTSIVNAHLFNCSHILAKNDGSGFDRPSLQKDALGYNAGYRLYQCNDEYICISIQNKMQWTALEKLLNTNDLNISKGEVLEEIFKNNSASHWYTELDKAGIPVEISNSNFSREMWQGNNHLLDAGWLVNVAHPVCGKVGHVGLPYQFSETKAKVQGRPLIVGESTRSILSEIGFSAEQQQQLFDTQCVADQSCYMYDVNMGQEK